MSGILAGFARDPDFVPFWKALHDRLCAGRSADQIVTLKVTDLPLGALAELRTYLDTSTRRRRGRSAVTVEGTTTEVPLRELLQVADASANEVALLAEQVTGRPVVNLAADRREAAGQRRELWEHADAAFPRLPRLVRRLKASGIGADVPKARRLITALAHVTERVPYTPPVSLPKLAHDCAGDPHYFDLGGFNGGCLVYAVMEVTGRPEPTLPHHTRALLAEAGIFADRLTSTILLHRIRATGDGVIDRRLRESDVPVALTLLDLTRDPPTLASQTVTVVENPSVLEAAMACGSDVPLACTSGHLRAVDHVFLQLARDQGVRLRYAGDLDHDGFQIAATVADQYGAELLAMDAETVTEAGPSPSSVPLRDRFAASLRSDLGLTHHAVFQEHDAVTRRILSPDLHDDPPVRTTLRARP
ncbi:DUF2399 domain-containing protein [Actinomadura luteofluorescens]|uniref:DUF2399 domain-containing protein n=1 Tax=Actinomadura luteofluorescens TaxID=46163 RepID=UPI0034890C74